MRLHLPGAAGDVDVRPETAGWQYAGLSVFRLAPGSTRRVRTRNTEVFVVPLSGHVSVEVTEPSGRRAALRLAGRRSVFAGATDFLYAGPGSIVVVTSDVPAEVAVPSARCNTPRPTRYQPADHVTVETRGAGVAAREVRNFGTPEAWPDAERLMACEVITPPGHWSSYPPHKHDASDPCMVANEEIYFFRISGADMLTPSRDGFGFHRTYTGPEHERAGLAPLDACHEVRDRDVVLVPHGYHGPCVAAPGYAMYYLNVLAGQGPRRSMAFCDDPAHAWIRASWTAAQTASSASAPKGSAG